MDSKWIWYPGEFEILQANKILFYRQYRGVICPPFWKVDGLYYSVFFFKKVKLEKKAQIYIKTNSIISVIAGIGENQIITKQDDDSFCLPEGEYMLCISAYNPNNQLPCIFVYGPDGIYSDETWFVDNVGSRVDLKPVGFSDTMGREDDPNSFKLSINEKEFNEKLNIDSNEIYDFGRETIGYLKFCGITGVGKIYAYYGESIEEAQDIKACETFDCFDVNDSEYVSVCSRGFRYVNIKCSKGISFEKMTLLYEYLPLQYRGDFKCSSDSINDIYDMSVYTLHLNSR